jgi:hypothetical protein
MSLKGFIRVEGSSSGRGGGYQLVRWQKICRSKKKGGLGIKNLWKMNIGLLCKWWWSLETGEGLWQDIVRIKYMKGSPICLIPK